MCPCAGIVNFGVQAMLFVFLLYALLATESDPLSYTIKVLVRPECHSRPVAVFGLHSCQIAALQSVARRRHCHHSNVVANTLLCDCLAAVVRRRPREDRHGVQ